MAAAAVGQLVGVDTAAAQAAQLHLRGWDQADLGQNPGEKLKKNKSKRNFSWKRNDADIFFQETGQEKEP